MNDIPALFAWMPQWLQAILIFGVTIVLAWVAHSLLFRALIKLVEERGLFLRSLVSRGRGPARLVILLIGFAFAAQLAPLTQRGSIIASSIFVVGIIGLMGILAYSALHIFTIVYLRRFKLDAEDNALARKHTTQMRILQRVGNALIFITVLAAMLMTFESVRTYGVSLLASAGAAGLIAALALQPVLKNLFAGIQIAITQPISLDDAVIVEGEWGTIEEITSTYVVVKIWDWRRLVVPISYFIETPFQNWSRESTSLIGAVKIYLDHTAPIDAIRQKAHEIAKKSKLWDKQEFYAQVTDFNQTNMELRILASARNSANAYDLRCEIREQLVTWLQNEHPGALPRIRSEIDKLPDGLADNGIQVLSGTGGS